jgi:hypothetical protein
MNAMNNIIFPFSTRSLEYIINDNQEEYILLHLKTGEIIQDPELSEKWLNRVVKESASWSYSFYQRDYNGKTIDISTLPYSEGSLRDDFDFGPLALVQSALLKQYLDTHPQTYQYAAWYDFRLWLSRQAMPLHYLQAVCLYHENPKPGEKQFAYVDPANRERQIEMEQVATNHLKEIGAILYPPFAECDYDEGTFEIEASVIIPVKNRVKTLADAIESVLQQKTSFPFNLIVIDNHSTDGTTELIRRFTDPRLVHLIPEKTNLGIGGCWNEGVNHPACGRFSVQIDSDDLYLDENTLQKIIDKFHQGKYAMVIGSYKMVDFNLNEIPPGIIDHREWTDHNGPNNALRINGLGAPRAFFTPVIREIGFPDVSYGEDYAVALAISRTYKVGRIFEPVYLCRRWDDNTDANLSPEKVNRNNLFKDSLRAKEIEIRKSR